MQITWSILFNFYLLSRKFLLQNTFDFQYQAFFLFFFYLFILILSTFPHFVACFVVLCKNLICLTAVLILCVLFVYAYIFQDIYLLLQTHTLLNWILYPHFCCWFCFLLLLYLHFDRRSRKVRPYATTHSQAMFVTHSCLLP